MRKAIKILTKVTAFLVVALYIVVASDWMHQVSGASISTVCLTIIPFATILFMVSEIAGKIHEVIEAYFAKRSKTTWSRILEVSKGKVLNYIKRSEKIDLLDAIQIFGAYDSDHEVIRPLLRKADIKNELIIPQKQSFLSYFILNNESNYYIKEFLQENVNIKAECMEYSKGACGILNEVYMKGAIGLEGVEIEEIVAALFHACLQWNHVEKERLLYISKFVFQWAINTIPTDEKMFYKRQAYLVLILAPFVKKKLCTLNLHDGVIDNCIKIIDNSSWKKRLLREAFSSVIDANHSCPRQDYILYSTSLSMNYDMLDLCKKEQLINMVRRKSRDIEVSDTLKSDSDIIAMLVTAIPLKRVESENDIGNKMVSLLYSCIDFENFIGGL